ncbi:uncharacterized protein LOC107774831 isoform X2 [Nicotiana tabacum]|uniref:Uncharacterized protein LOC107774831 isoform X2 n=2 Tax=Nicotiana TaxID=4085 RepID=A0AC58UEX1_TOBAC|nr:PREDICTED: uncharacterized aarF domain-containing protein kinase At1g79600, chloroplastic isoform X3 [Nicotiana sylvestris]
MRSIISCLKRRRLAVLSPTLRFGCSIETALCEYSSSSFPEVILTGKHDNFVGSYLSAPKYFSTGFSSVHGERPTAEYAKLRKESLESEFGHALTYKSKSLSSLYRFGPFLALYRATIISFYVLKLTIWRLFVHDIRRRAVKFRETLIRLGPFYIKLGQALSTRPDILPKVYCQELAKLQDQIPPFPTHVARRSIESQLGVGVSQVFADISKEPIAAASLGQVYKAHLHSGELVAVKVQRPHMSHLLTLDAMLFHMIGGQLKRFAKARKDLLVAVNEMVRHMFEEIDYILEAQNAERFASLYACSHKEKIVPGSAATDNVACQKNDGIKVPKIYWNFTRKEVLTMEWIDGIKLTNESRLRKANLNRRRLIDHGLYCSLRQLLEVGFFHADPHPGNLVATEDGALAYFDFGMMGDIPRHYRVGLIKVGIMNQLYDVMYEFNFSLPPDYALVIRALGSLEGTAKALDPDFKVVESAYPFVIGRLLVDPTPDMRRILRELLIRNDGTIRWNRLERLIAAISQQASETEGETQESYSNPLGSFDIRAVVSATEDLLQFILSDKGSRVRVFLVRDIVKAADVFYQDEVLNDLLDEKLRARRLFGYEEHGILVRVMSGFRSLGRAVKLAPDLWSAMLIRMVVKPEFQKFAFDIGSALTSHFKCQLPVSFWMGISRLLHRVVDKNEAEVS